MSKPKLRKVFPTNTEEESERDYFLEDPFGLAPSRVELTAREFGWVQLMNGERDCSEIARLWGEENGESVEVSEVEGIAALLSRNLLLDGDGFQSAYEGAEAEFREAPVRTMRHHGEGYPRDPGVFEAELQGWFGGTLPDFSKVGERVPAIFAPHIDIPLAGPSYAGAFGPAAADRANEMYVVLGTAHYRDVNPFIVTEKAFETPWGLVAADREFIADLREAYGGDLSRDELIHKVEHSVEFQAVFLQGLLHGQREFTIIPILVSSFASHVKDGELPTANPVIADFLEALTETVASRAGKVCVVAGVDLAHVGLKFGDDFPPDARTLEDLKAADHKSLRFACDLDGDGFWTDVMADGNARKVCGVSPMYVASKVLRETRGEVVSYGTDYRPDEGYVVTFGGVVFRGP
ncbi:MAG: AmmeMemoRadiSam system protein B [Planctomycetota bacterium]|jgi:AmmeMemoRadiSam system protein B